MKKIALLIIDVQAGLINNTLYNKNIVIDNIKKIIASANDNNLDVIYVRHDDGKGSQLECGTPGWQIYNEVEPKCHNKIFDKQYNSAFNHTELKHYLNNNNITELIIVGLQTDYCIDATVKTAFELGFSVVIPQDCTSTVDNFIFKAIDICKYYEMLIWNNRYAKLLPVDDVLNLMSNL